MVRDELYITAPNLFRCPISMDVMRSPVSLCTGVTYDRSSIQLWLDSGHDTCPATMQILPSKDIVPNLTLRRLINLWSQSNGPPSPSFPSQISPSDLFPLLRRLPAALPDLLALAASGDANRRVVSASADLATAAVILAADASSERRWLECSVRVLDLILAENRFYKVDRIQSVLSSVAVVLREGSSSEARVSAARVAEFSSAAAAENEKLVDVIVEVIGERSDRGLQEAVLAAAAAVASAGSRAAKARLVEAGAVRRVAEVVGDRAAGRSAVEKAMRVVAAVSSVAEGRAEIGEGAVAVVVAERLVKVSAVATEDGVTALWNVFCGGGGCGEGRRRAAEVVAVGGGVHKVLLVMQSGCGERVRRMCLDLLNVLKKVSSFQGLDSGNDVVQLGSDFLER